MSRFEGGDVCWRIARSLCEEVDELEDEELGKGASKI